MVSQLQAWINITRSSFFPCLSPTLNGMGFRQQFWLHHVNQALGGKNVYSEVVPECFCDYLAIYINLQASLWINPRQVMSGPLLSRTPCSLQFASHCITDTSMNRKELEIGKPWAEGTENRTDPQKSSFSIQQKGVVSGNYEYWHISPVYS